MDEIQRIENLMDNGSRWTRYSVLGVETDVGSIKIYSGGCSAGPLWNLSSRNRVTPVSIQDVV